MLVQRQAPRVIDGSRRDICQAGTPPGAPCFFRRTRYVSGTTDVLRTKSALGGRVKSCRPSWIDPRAMLVWHLSACRSLIISPLSMLRMVFLPWIDPRRCGYSYASMAPVFSIERVKGAGALLDRSKMLMCDPVVLRMQSMKTATPSQRLSGRMSWIDPRFRHLPVPPFNGA